MGEPLWEGPPSAARGPSIKSPGLVDCGWKLTFLGAESADGDQPRATPWDYNAHKTRALKGREDPMPQSLAKNILHLVFSTRRREPVLLETIRAPLCSYIAAVLRNLDSPVIGVNAWRDHLHVLFVLSRKYPLSRVVMEAKRASSRWLKEQHPTLKNFQWQAGYGAFSIAQSGVQQVEAYIAVQAEHHRTRTFNDEYRELLNCYQIDFDERYVWD